MEATYSSETSVDFQRTTRRYIPEDSTMEKVQKPSNSEYRIFVFVKYEDFYTNFS
jgi:hypothetical protein